MAVIALVFWGAVCAETARSARARMKVVAVDGKPTASDGGLWYNGDDQGRSHLKTMLARRDKLFRYTPEPKS